MADIKLGGYIPTMYVTSKIEKTGTPMKINESDFNPKLHAKIESASKPKAKAEPKPKPK
jgi:hypothetical protein